MHDPPMAVIVVDGIVLGCPIVPEGEGSHLPTKATGEFRPDLMAEQVIQYRRALLLRHTGEAGGVRDVNVQRFAPSFGMGADRRVLGRQNGRGFA